MGVSWCPKIFVSKVLNHHTLLNAITWQYFLIYHNLDFRSDKLNWLSIVQGGFVCHLACGAFHQLGCICRRLFLSRHRNHLKDPQVFSTKWNLQAKVFLPGCLRTLLGWQSWLWEMELQTYSPLWQALVRVDQSWFLSSTSTILIIKATSSQRCLEAFLAREYLSQLV